MKKLKSLRIYIRGFFTEGTYKNFLLHEFLLVINFFLFFVLLAEIFLITDPHHIEVIHKIELFFGILFSFEFLLRLYYVYMPNKIYFKPYLILNFLVILSLLVPQLFGNLAFLRLIRSLKIIKIFWLNKHQKEDMRKNSNFIDTRKVLKKGIQGAQRIAKKNEK